MQAPWLLLVYTVPAEPSRKRASIWRDVKKIGAVYLRDGVCILPERPATLDTLRAIAAKIDEFGGQASVVQAARLDARRAAAVVAQFAAARSAEYAEIASEAERLLEHVAREAEHREFTSPELEELDSDLGKLRRWTDQVRARDYFGTGPGEALDALLQQCDQVLTAFQVTPERHDVTGQPALVDEVNLRRRDDPSASRGRRSDGATTARGVFDAAHHARGG